MKWPFVISVSCCYAAGRSLCILTGSQQQREDAKRQTVWSCLPLFFKAERRLQSHTLTKTFCVLEKPGSGSVCFFDPMA